MSQFVDNMQATIKTTSSNAGLFCSKILSGAVLGLTLTLILQEILDYGTILFFFVLLTTVVVFMKIAKKWNWMSLFVFDLICVLVGLLLRMYVLIAPGA